MDARLVGEGIRADDRLVYLDGDPGQRADQAAGRHQALLLDAGPGAPELFGSGSKRHDNFFEGGVAGALADAIHRDFDLARTGANRRQRIGGAQSEVIVAMHRNNAVLDPSTFARQVLDQADELTRRGVTDGIWHVERRGAGLDRRPENLDQVIGIRPGCILAGELDIADERSRECHRFRDPLEHLFPGHPQLVLEVDVGGGDEGVDTRVVGLPHCLGCTLDVAARWRGQVRPP